MAATEHRGTESKPRKSARRVEELYRTALALDNRPAPLAAHAVEALATLLNLPLAMVERLEGDEGVVVAMIRNGQMSREERIPIPGTPRVHVRSGRHHCVFRDVTSRFPDCRLLGASRIGTYAGFPIMDPHNDVIGIISVMDARARVFRDEELGLLDMFATRLATAFEEERIAADRSALFSRLEADNAELRAAQARLIQTDRVRTEFLGMMSHELRTPVNILIGYAHMLLESVAAGDPLPGTERAAILRRMVAGGHTLSELVEDTLSVLRLDAGAVRLELETIALDKLFHDLKGNDRLLREACAVEERWIAEPNVPDIVTDRRKLRQVITNLVGNARKFTDHGSIEVRAVVAGGDRIRISVTDTGCGIGPEHLPHIFELYQQAPSGQTHDGCGIGLYIVRRYLEMLQGRVECTSTLGKGTTFTVELPHRVDETATSAASGSPSSQAARAAAS
jgi:signal transduction histidine kinase